MKSLSSVLKMDLATYVVARLAMPESDSSSDSTSASSDADSSSESISLPTNARALPDELFLCDEDFEEDLEEDFEYFFFFLSSESYSLLFFLLFSLSHCGHSEMKWL